MLRLREEWYLKENPFQDFNEGGRNELMKLSQTKTHTKKGYNNFVEKIKTRRAGERKQKQDDKTEKYQDEGNNGVFEDGYDE